MILSYSAGSRALDPDAFRVIDRTEAAALQSGLEALGYEVSLRPLTSGLHAIEIG